MTVTTTPQIDRPGHYYWLTALLAARGAQRRICGMVAVSAATLGVLPLLLSFGHGGFQGLRARIVALFIAVCCFAMASVWLRHCWPSRAQSQACVVIGTACLATACLLNAQPILGLVGCTASAVLSAHVAFFHSRSLLLYTWAVVAITLTVLTVDLAGTYLTVALSGVVIVAVANVFAAFACRSAIRLIDNGIRYADIEPLTGLLNREAFYGRIATLIGARTRDDDRYLVVAVLDMDGFSVLAGVAGIAETLRARIAVGLKLRETARRDAVIAHVTESEFLIAELFTTPDASAFLERVRGSVTGPPSRLTASIGAVSTPLSRLIGSPPPVVLDEVLSVASAAMHQARRAGGNQARLVINPALAVHDRDAGS